jgi:hypothetical protein
MGALVICLGLLCARQANADPIPTDASISGKVVDDFGVPVTNINVFAVGVWGQTNTFNALTDTNGNFQIAVIGGVGGYFLRLDMDPDSGALSRGLVSFWIAETVPAGGSVTNLALVARRITGSITVTIVNGGVAGPYSGLIPLSSINLNGAAVTIDSFGTNGPTPTPIQFDTNLVSITNLFHPNISTNLLLPKLFPPKNVITNIRVIADLIDRFPEYIATAQRTDTNGTAVLFLCDGSWSVEPDCIALDAMNLNCQINRTKGATVASNNVAITLTYYTNAPLQIVTNMIAGTNGLPYNGSLQASGGYWPFTWNIVGGTLPPGLTQFPYGDKNVFTGQATQEGSYTLTVQVTDNLQQTSITNITIKIMPTPPPRLSAPLCLDASQFQLHLAGLSNRNYTIQFTTNLTDWTTLAVTNVMGPDTIFVDTNSEDAMRIYRVLQGP